MQEAVAIGDGAMLAILKCLKKLLKSLQRSVDE